MKIKEEDENEISIKQEEICYDEDIGMIEIDIGVYLAVFVFNVPCRRIVKFRLITNALSCFFSVYHQIFYRLILQMS